MRQQAMGSLGERRHRAGLVRGQHRLGEIAAQRHAARELTFLGGPGEHLRRMAAASTGLHSRSGKFQARSIIAV